MSKPEKHIENIYRERLLNAEVSPPPKAWDKIAGSLDNAAKNRRLLFYRRLVASAAVIIILLSVGIGFLYQKRQITTPENLTIAIPDSSINVIDSTLVIPIQPIQENLAEKEPTERDEIKSSKTPIINKIFTAQKLTPNEKSTNSALIAMQQIASGMLFLTYEWPALIIPQKEPDQRPFIYDSVSNSLMINENLIADAASNEPRKRRWSLGGEISPSHAKESARYNSGIESASVAGDMMNHYISRRSSEESITAYTGGLAVNYIISDKISFQSGLYYFKQGQEISNFDVLSNEAALDNSITTTSNSGTIEFNSTDVITNNNPIRQIELDANNRIAQFDESLVQKFGFIEIPLILKYKILSKGLDIYLLGGLNANILINNHVFIGQNNNNSVGYTEGINSLIYKSTLGLSLEYPISDNFYLNLSPIIKHQLNPINKNNSGTVRTNFFEYKTGISYRF